MKYRLILALLVLSLVLTACTLPAPPTEPTQPSETESTPTLPTESDPTVPTQTDPTEETKPEHSPLYIPGLSVEDVIRYFNEVCLDAEFVNNGDATLVQKWVDPIFYKLEGEPTMEDHAMLSSFMAWLNAVEGFPGFVETEEGAMSDLRIYFCTADFMTTLLGPNFEYMDGGVTFWYNGINEITDATICYRTDLSQTVRNSVILEEIYNGLGPVQDTDLRPDSIIYSGYSEPQSLTEIDELILKLLYHPDIKCGMNAQQCEEIIRKLYY